MKEVIKSIKRTPYQILASFIVLLLSSFTIASLLFITLFFQALLKKVELSPQVIIYFRPETEESLISQVKDEIGRRFKTKSIKYVSQKEALNIYRSMFTNEPLLTEMVSAEMLPPSLEIKVKNPEELYKIAEFAKKQKGVDEVDFQKDIVDKLLSITSLLRKISIGVGAAISFFTLIILISIISFKVSLKKEEIEILKLLGASNLFVYKPFLKENLFIALISSLISFVVLFSILLYFTPFINTFFWQGEDLLLTLPYFETNLTIWPLNTFVVATIALFTLLLSSLIAIISTIIAASKYVK